MIPLHNVPAQLAKENKKFVYAALGTGARAREYESALQWLGDATERKRRTSPSMPSARGSAPFLSKSPA